MSCFRVAQSADSRISTCSSKTIKTALQAILIIAFAATAVSAQITAPDFSPGLKWRLIGPHRAGRVTSVAGIAGNPRIYYMGTPGGGVWKTSNGGETWEPIFDQARVASIGAIAVAPSNPNIVYVGTGEQTRGNGVYKSTDAGKTWAQIGLEGTHFIQAILVDPTNPNIVLVAAAGPNKPAPDRGVFKSTDGGKVWKKTLSPDDHTGVDDLCSDPANPRLLFAAVSRETFGDEKKPQGPDSSIYKSADQGETWALTGEASLPKDERGRIGIAVAAGKSGKRIFAVMDQGFFRSEDAGNSWEKITNDPRVVGSGYFSRIFADPWNSDVVYVMQTCIYRSTDGGRTFEAFKGAPSGEDHHVFWIAPDDPQRIILGSDQGATITVDGGKTWSLWFNQPTGQLYSVSTDNQFPYHLYASQQDSGSVVAPNRSDFGLITYREWFSSGSFESAHIAPDPSDPNIVFSIGWFGTVYRLDRVTGQIATVFISPANYRTAWETPLVFSPRDSNALYFGSQFVLKSSDHGFTWKEISPDLAQLPVKPEDEKRAAPAAGNAPHSEEEEYAQSARRGALQTIAPSPLENDTIWAGNNFGRIYLTRDGSKWQEVTPAGLAAKSLVRMIEASHYDANAAYAVITVSRDSHPYIYRTKDAGKSWQLITAGLPDNRVARAVREDSTRSGLLYAGTETGVYLSFDSGDHWSSLQLNLPTTSMTDLSVHGDDLVLSTLGRGLWILDDITPIRQWNPGLANSPATLLAPEIARRVHWDNHPDTPINPEMPAAQNPPDGAIINYYLKAAPKAEITLDISDEKGKLIRRFSSRLSSSKPEPPANVPDYWFAPPSRLPADPGFNRFVWNLRLPEPEVLSYSYYGQHLDYVEFDLPDHAVPGLTPRHQPEGPIVVPARYDLALTVDGKTYRQSLEVKLDPRVHVSTADLQAQLDLASSISNLLNTTAAGYDIAATLSRAIGDRKKSLAAANAPKDVMDKVAELGKQLSAVQDGAGDDRGFGTLNRDISRFLIMVESADLRPTASAYSAVQAACQDVKKTLLAWQDFRAKSLPAFDALLSSAKLPALPVSNDALAEPACSN